MKPVLVNYPYFSCIYSNWLFGRSLTTREELGAGNGALGGATVGGIIGAAVGHPGAGTAAGGTLGLGPGLLIGDQLQGQEQIDSNQAKLDRQRRVRKTQEAGRILALRIRLFLQAEIERLI
jgi:outer membrane lipoprotein SlyB